MAMISSTNWIVTVAVAAVLVVMFAGGAVVGSALASSGTYAPLVALLLFWLCQLWQARSFRRLKQVGKAEPP